MQTVITLCIYILLACGLVSCRSCNDGFFWDESKSCVKCPDNCQFCESNEYCLSCKNGYWGNACEQSCSACNADTSCDKTNGFCLESCKDGYTGVLCDSNCSERCLSCNRTNAQICVGCAYGWYPPVSCNKSCPAGCLDSSCSAKDLCTNGCSNGFYGQLCELRCPGYCRENLCYQDNGTCVHGCEGKFTGTTCDTPKQTGNSAAVVAVPVLVLVLVFVVVIAIIIVVWRKRRLASRPLQPEETQEMLPPDVKRSNESTNPGSARKEKTEESSQPQAPAGNILLKRLCFCFKEQEANKTKNGTDVASSETQPLCTKPDKPVPTKKTENQKLQEIVDRIKFKTDKELDDEFCKLPVALQKSHNRSLEKENATAIEREGVFPYDENIVTVFGAKKLYVNASFIKDKGGNTYIASRGPINNDGSRRMWRLLWENDCKTVVMLNTFEKRKKGNYWPSNEKEKTYDEMSVKSEDKHKTKLENEEYNVRRFRLKEGKDTKHVIQLQYTGWPEKEVPDRHNLLAFITRVREFHSEDSGPIVVHGRRGVGRTGTFIALDMLMKEVDDLLHSDEDKTIDMFHCVKNLRKQRTLMVENIKQYKFLHEALQQYAEDLLQKYQNTRNENTETTKEKDKRNTETPKVNNERNTETPKERDERNTEISKKKDERNTKTSKVNNERNTETPKERDERNTETSKKNGERNTKKPNENEETQKEKDERNTKIRNENKEPLKEEEERNTKTPKENKKTPDEKNESNTKTPSENKETQKDQDERNTKTRNENKETPKDQDKRNTKTRNENKKTLKEKE